MRARRKKRLSVHRGAAPPTSGRDQAWSMDFVHDQLVSGRAFQVLTVIDQWSRESVLMEANVAMTGQSVVDALEAPPVGRSRRPSRSITAPSSRPGRSTNGPTGADRAVALGGVYSTGKLTEGPSSP